MCLLHVQFAAAQQIEFEGTPFKRVQNSFENRQTFDLDADERGEFSVRIVQEGENYFWATRDNTPMVKVESGIYVTYIAANGSGFVRTLNETARDAFLQAPDNNIIGQITYIEHLLLGLESITYYGR